MKKSEQAISLIAEIVLEYVPKIIGRCDERLTGLLNALAETQEDGRSTWSPERREAHGKKIQEHWSTKRATQEYFLQKVDGTILTLKGIEAAAKAVGLRVSSLKTRLSADGGVIELTRDGGTVLLSRTRDGIEDRRYARFHETGNPDDIRETRKIMRPRPELVKKPARNKK